MWKVGAFLGSGWWERYWQESRHHLRREVKRDNNYQESTCHINNSYVNIEEHDVILSWRFVTLYYSVC
jgi:hypothetical protein